MSDVIGNVLWAVFVIGMAIALRLGVGNLDRQRIREYIEKGGGQILSIVWNPMGPGWWGSRERIYDVSYKTHDGEVRSATCKTTMFSGVYWTGDAPAGLTTASESAQVSREPNFCMQCGTKLASHQTICPDCGWSYRQ